MNARASAVIGVVRGTFPGRRALEAFFISPMVVPIVVELLRRPRSSDRIE